MYFRFLGSGFVASAVLLVLFSVFDQCHPGGISPLDGDPIADLNFIPRYDDAMMASQPADPAGESDEPQVVMPAVVKESLLIAASNLEEDEPVIESVLEFPALDAVHDDELPEEEPVESITVQPVTQTSFALPVQETHSVVTDGNSEPVASVDVVQTEQPVLADPVIHYDFRMTHPAMYVRNHGLHYYRRLMRCHRAPHPHELLGTWRGVNKGPATVAIDRQFIKQFYLVNGCVYGDNIMVHQVSDHQLACCGWKPIVAPCTGEVKRQGRFAVEPPQGHGRFSHGLVLNYRAGNNRDATRAIWDQVVKLDDNHMLGRATVRMGRHARLPVAFFVLERIPE